MNLLNLNSEQRAEFVGDLRKQIMRVSFVKKDETHRLMLCTLNDALIPVEHYPKSTEPVTGFDLPVHERPAVRVYDVVNEGWRTIIFDTIFEVEFAA